MNLHYIKKSSLSIIIALFIISCTNYKEEKTRKKLYLTKISSDSIIINCNNSGNGFIQSLNNKIFYIDRDYCTINEIDLSKNLSTSHLGLKDTALKVKKIDGIVYYKNKYYIFSYKTIVIADEEFSILKKANINFFSTQSRAYLEAFPKSDNPAIYEPHFFSYCVFLLNNKIFLSIDTEHTLFNAYSNPDYYKKGYGLASISAISLQITNLLAHRNGIYLDHQNLPFFNGVRGTGCGNNIYISFEADSMIHVHNTLDNSITYIGRQPYFFNSNYPTYNSIDVAFDQNLYKKERRIYGHYSNLHYDSTNGHILRQYYSGEYNHNTHKNGFQIFDTKNNICIAEHEISQFTNIFHYTNNTAYAYKIPSNDKIIIYKIKLSE